jgi:microcystin degradation protein MlrC
MPAEIAGFYRHMDSTGDWTPCPGMIAAAPPGGPIDHALFLTFLDEMRRGLTAALPLDGVYVASHGASSATGDEDSDGTMLAMIRQVVGQAVPIVVTHDLHCNVSEKLIDSCDVFIAYRTNPHVDMAARAAEAADAMRELLGGLKTAKAFLRLPLTPPSVTLLTAEGPYADLVHDAEAIMAAEPAILNASVTGGFTFSDLPKCGITITVTARGGDEGAARRACAKLARRGWAERTRHQRRLLSLDEAAALSVSAGKGEVAPVIFSDAGDNPGGGGRGSTAYTLRKLHEARAEGVVLGLFVDPALAAEAQSLGEGAHFHAVFNREDASDREAPQERSDEEHSVNRPRSEASEFSKRFESGARVRMLTDGKGKGRRGTMAGRLFDLGPTALLELDDSGMRVVVISLRRQCHEPRTLEMHGIDIAAARTVVVKSRGHFRAGFDEFFPNERIFEVDSPGLTSPVLTNFAWKRLPRPAYPLDPDATWTDPGWN